MKSFFKKTFVSVLVIGSFTVLSFAAEPGGKGQVQKNLREYFRGLTDQGLFSGSVLVAREGNILYKEGLGLADYDTGRVNTPTTVYAIASMGKAFTAVSIMILEERGLLSVNDKLSDYMPNYPRGDEITIHQLLNMSAGIYNYARHPGLRISEYHSHEEMLQYFMNEPMEHEPGTDWAYCNSCYFLLGMIVEQVSGMTYRDFLRVNIFEPLKMEHSGYDPDGFEFDNKKAVGYDHIQTVPPPVSITIHPTVTFSAGGIYSTVTDMYKWHRSFQTEALLSRDTLDRIFTPGLGNYGYGWFIESHEVAGQEREMIWHWGSYLGYHGFIAHLPAEDIFILLQYNFTAPNPEDRYQALPYVKGAAEIILNH